MHAAMRLLARLTMLLRKRHLARTPLGRSLMQHRGEIVYLAEQYGFTNVRVFGSAARGNVHTKSDIDLLVDFRDLHGLKTDLFDIIGAKQDMSDVLGVPVDLIPATYLKEGVRPSVLREVITL